MKQAESFEELYQQIAERKGPFLLVFTVVLALTYGLLYAIDFVPEPVAATPVSDTEVVDVVDTPSRVEETVPDIIATAPAVATPAENIPAADRLPRKIIIDALDKELPVLNPTSRVIADLDEALLSGVVRHPDSADFGSDGNVFILGHSSYLPTVFNRNFQAFNGLQDLVWGDVIRVQSNDTEYVYRVQEVYQAKASEVFVPNTPGEARLTLATCNSFGSKDDRFIVEAVLISKKSI